MFRKSQEVWARNFDPKGVNGSRKPNLGTLCPPPPRVIGLMSKLIFPINMTMIWFAKHAKNLNQLKMKITF